MKKVTYAIAAMGLALTASQAGAGELWNQHLRGSDTGGAAGALPPQGVYFVDDNYYGAFASQGDTSANNKPKTSLDVFVNIPILLWSTGYKILGGDFAVAAAQPFDYTNVRQANNAALSDDAHWGTFNTILVPAIISWALPYDLHVKGQFSVALDDASSSPSTPPSATNGAGAGNAFYTFEPSVGLSYLHDGWNASVAVRYDTSTQDSKSYSAPHGTSLTGTYQSGDQLSTDWTLSKAIGKWTAGVVAYQQASLQRDTINGKDTAGTSRTNAGVGPLVGYQFGGIGVQASYQHEIVTHNDFGGDVFQVKFVVPVY